MIKRREGEREKEWGRGQTRTERRRGREGLTERGEHELKSVKQDEDKEREREVKERIGEREDYKKCTAVFELNKNERKRRKSRRVSLGRFSNNKSKASACHKWCSPPLDQSVKKIHSLVLTSNCTAPFGLISATQKILQHSDEMHHSPKFCQSQTCGDLNYCRWQTDGRETW